MKKLANFFKKFVSIFAIMAIIVSNPAFASINSGIDTQELFKLDSGAIQPLNPNWTVCSAAERCDAFFDTADITTAIIGSLSFGFIENSVIFTDASGNLTEDSSNLVFVDSTNSFGIGVSDPDEQLEIAGRFHMGQDDAPATVTDKLYNVLGNLFWNGTDVLGITTPITEVRGGTGQSTYAQGDILYSDGSDSLAVLTKGLATEVLTMNAGATAPEWAVSSGGASPYEATVCPSGCDYATISAAVTGGVNSVLVTEDITELAFTVPVDGFYILVGEGVTVTMTDNAVITVGNDLQVEGLNKYTSVWAPVISNNSTNNFDGVSSADNLTINNIKIDSSGITGASSSIARTGMMNVSNIEWQTANDAGGFSDIDTGSIFHAIHVIGAGSQTSSLFAPDGATIFDDISLTGTFSESAPCFFNDSSPGTILSNWTSSSINNCEIGIRGPTKMTNIHMPRHHIDFEGTSDESTCTNCEFEVIDLTDSSADRITLTNVRTNSDIVVAGDDFVANGLWAEANLTFNSGADNGQVIGANILGVLTDNGANNSFDGRSLGEFYIFENTVEAEIEAVDQWHPAIGGTVGVIDGFTFFAGSSIDILSFADYSGTVAGTIKATTNGAHSYATGDIISQVGALIEVGDPDPYYGQYSITVVDADEYYFTNPDWNATQTAVAIKPASLTAGDVAVGTYLFNGTGSVTSAGNDKVFDFSLFRNTTSSEKAEARFKAKIAGDFQSIAGSSFIDIVAGDVLWFGIKGITDDANMTMRYGNFNTHRF